MPANKINILVVRSKTNKPVEQEIIQAVEALKSGQTILYPTDTVWGLGCDATNPVAVKKIYRIKKRDDSKAMLILLDDINRLGDYVVKVPDVAWDIVEYSEMPLTVVYQQGKNIAPELLGEDGSIAIRVTKNDFCKKIIRKLGRPIVSTSANISGESTGGRFQDIPDEIKKNVDYIVGYNQNDTSVRPPSRIISLGPGGEIKFLRK